MAATGTKVARKCEKYSNDGVGDGWTQAILECTGFLLAQILLLKIRDSCFVLRMGILVLMYVYMLRWSRQHT
jgi:hypothetical protein